MKKSISNQLENQAIILEKQSEELIDNVQKLKQAASLIDSANDNLYNSNEELANIASLILYKFTEGKEDLQEYRDLAENLINSAKYIKDEQIKTRILSRTTEFKQRLNKILGE